METLPRSRSGYVAVNGSFSPLVAAPTRDPGFGHRGWGCRGWAAWRLRGAVLASQPGVCPGGPEALGCGGAARGSGAVPWCKALLATWGPPGDALGRFPVGGGFARSREGAGSAVAGKARQAGRGQPGLGVGT